MKLEELTLRLKNKELPIDWPGHWLGGTWRPAERGELRSSMNPSRNSLLMSFKESKDVVEQAINLAEEHQNEVAALSKSERIDIITRLAQAFADCQEPLIQAMQLETGKPAWEARADMEAALRHLNWVANHEDEIYESILAPAKIGAPRGEFSLAPVGITAGFLPFSTPVTSFVFYFTATALTGCSLILVSSTHASLSCLLFALIADKLDLPKGILNIVFGSYLSFKQTFSNKRIAGVLYTGSYEHCEEIKKSAAIKTGRQLVMQSGGKNAVLVHSSADLNTAVRNIIYGVVKSSGQLCSSTSRVFVYRGIAKEFISLLSDSMDKIKIGATDDFEDKTGPLMGPLYSKKAVDRFLRFQTMAHRAAKKTILWGKSLELDEGGSFVSPGIHLMEHYDSSNAYQENVIFCPDLSIYEYDVLDEAITDINDTKSSLALSFIGERHIIDEKRHQVNAPNILVNLPTVEVESTLPLAGRFSTGISRFHGPAMALYLCLPQIVQDDDVSRAIVNDWPYF
ncbi:MAG: aldehyde dehydrogenase family protein [Bdellovibrionota bacterium]